MGNHIDRLRECCTLRRRRDACVVKKAHGSISPPASKCHSAGSTSWSLKLPCACRDVSTTDDGRMLLAAGHRGLLEYGANGLPLSGWRPSENGGGSNRNSDGNRDNDGNRDRDDNDTVLSVQVLSDGRVALGLGHSRVVVLLSDGGPGHGEAWTESRRFAALQWSPGYLSACGHHIVAAEARYDHGRSQWNSGDHVSLLSLIDGRQLCVQKRDYLIWGVAAAAGVVVTTSLNKVRIGGSCGAEAYVLDGYSHEGQLLWRFEADNGESVQGVCADRATGRTLCLSIWKFDYSSGRVAVINAASGTVLRQVALSFGGRLMPVRLSLSRAATLGSSTVLHALCWDPNNWRHFTLAAYAVADLDALLSSGERA